LTFRQSSLRQAQDDKVIFWFSVSDLGGKIDWQRLVAVLGLTMIQQSLIIHTRITFSTDGRAWSETGPLPSPHIQQSVKQETINGYSCCSIRSNFEKIMQIGKSGRRPVGFWIEVSTRQIKLCHKWINKDPP
jgi:hypothetical protein